MDYPKLPTGPTPVGAAGVRALQAEGGEFQRTRRTIDTESRRADEFSRATVQAAEYITGGKLNSDKFAYREVPRYIMPFIPSVATGAQVNMGRGRYARWVTAPWTSDTVLTYTYTVAPGVTKNFQVRRFVGPRGIRTGNFYGSGSQIGGIIYEVYLPLGYSGDTYFPNQPDMVLTRPAQPYPQDQQLAVFMLGDNGRKDVANRPLQDLFILSFYRKQPTLERAITTTSFTRADAEFFPAIPTVATKVYTYAILAEQFFKIGPTPGPADPKVYIVRAQDHNLDAPSISDVTSVMVGGRWMPAPTTPGRWEPANSVEFNARLGIMLSSVTFVVLPEDWVLAFYRVYCDDSGTLRWRSRMVKFRASGGLSITRVLDEALPTDQSGTYYQSAIHLGENAVLAKKVIGFGGTDFDVNLVRSYDGGATWETLPMLGFNTVAKNQFFGDLLVHKARKDGEPGVILMNAWDATAQAYYTYESKNDGTSWVRRGRIYKPDAFRRVDSMLAEDGGGNFEELVPGPNPLRPVDITLPDRYTPVE